MAGTGDKLLTASEIKEVTDTKVNKTDTIAIEHGGTNATSASNARTNLGVYSKSEVDTAIAQSTAYISADSLSQLEDTIVSVGSTMGNGESKYGYCFPNFVDSDLGFDGYACSSVMIQRSSAGVYVATFISPMSFVTTDYYYSSTHHWHIGKPMTYTDVNVGSITVGSSGYIDISGFIPSGILPVLTAIKSFGRATGAVAITTDGKYAFGAPDTTVTNTTLRYFYHG